MSNFCLKGYREIRSTKCTTFKFSLNCVHDSRYELHPRVRGPWSVRGVLPLPLAHGGQPIPRRAPHPEPCGYFLLGLHLLHALQKEDFLENLEAEPLNDGTAVPEDIVYIRLAGVKSCKHLESGKRETDLFCQNYGGSLSLNVCGFLLSNSTFFLVF